MMGAPGTRGRSGPSILWIAAATFGLSAACGPAPEGPDPSSEARVAVAASLPGSVPSAVADAFARTNRIRVQLRRLGADDDDDEEVVVVDRTLPFDPNREVTDVSVRVTLTEGSEDFLLSVVLRRDDARLFRGSGTVTLSPGRTNTAEVNLSPIPAGVVIRTDGPVVISAGADSAVQAEADVVFATGDAIPELPVDWFSRNGQVAEVSSDGRIFPGSPGETHVIARHTPFRDSIRVEVLEQIGVQ